MSNFNKTAAINKANKITNIIGGRSFLTSIGVTRRFLLRGDGLGLMFCARNTKGYNSLEIKELNGSYTVVLQKVGKFHKEMQETITSLEKDDVAKIVKEATSYKSEMHYNPFWELLPGYTNEGRITTTLK